MEIPLYPQLHLNLQQKQISQEYLKKTGHLLV